MSELVAKGYALKVPLNQAMLYSPPSPCSIILMYNVFKPLVSKLWQPRKHLLTYFHINLPRACTQLFLILLVLKKQLVNSFGHNVVIQHPCTWNYKHKVKSLFYLILKKTIKVGDIGEFGKYGKNDNFATFANRAWKFTNGLIYNGY